MWKWLAPLGVFIVGMISLLIFQVFKEPIDDSVAVLQTQTADITENYWGWEWITSPGVIVLILFVMVIGIVLWQVAVRWMGRK